ncbi:MAG: hypothetical protein KBD50_03630 [Candidatus Pacebacteria bacterium]|nr:hypothetical protein [Candidatus Paceibacterota bacterium]
MKKKINKKKLPKNIVTLSVVSAASVVVTIVGLKSFDLALNGICPSASMPAAVMYTTSVPAQSDPAPIEEPLLLLDPASPTPETESGI